MGNKKIIILLIVAILVFSLILVLIMNQLAKSPQKDSTALVTTITTQQQPKVEARDGEEVLPTVEMGNVVGEVQNIMNDSMTIKTDKEILNLSIRGAFNVLALTEKGAEQKNISDVKVGSKVSVQHSKDNVVMSMYLLK